MRLKNEGSACNLRYFIRRSADLSANPMQVSSREISEAWHINSEGEARSCSLALEIGMGTRE